jgi:hypothetical protein
MLKRALTVGKQNARAWLVMKAAYEQRRSQEKARSQEGARLAQLTVALLVANLRRHIHVLHVVLKRKLVVLLQKVGASKTVVCLVEQGRVGTGARGRGHVAGGLFS